MVGGILVEPFPKSKWGEFFAIWVKTIKLQTETRKISRNTPVKESHYYQFLRHLTCYSFLLARGASAFFLDLLLASLLISFFFTSRIVLALNFAFSVAPSRLIYMFQQKFRFQENVPLSLSYASCPAHSSYFLRFLSQIVSLVLHFPFFLLTVPNHHSYYFLSLVRFSSFPFRSRLLDPLPATW